MKSALRSLTKVVRVLIRNKTTIVPTLPSFPVSVPTATPAQHYGHQVNFTPFQNTMRRNIQGNALAPLRGSNGSQSSQSLTSMASSLFRRYHTSPTTVTHSTSNFMTSSASSLVRAASLSRSSPVVVSRVGLGLAFLASAMVSYSNSNKPVINCQEDRQSSIIVSPSSATASTSTSTSNVTTSTSPNSNILPVSTLINSSPFSFNLSVSEDSVGLALINERTTKRVKIHAPQEDDDYYLVEASEDSEPSTSSSSLPPVQNLLVMNEKSLREKLVSAQQTIEMYETEKMCYCCLTKEKEVAYSCGHLLVCKDCDQKWEQNHSDCFYCNQPIQFKIYLKSI